MLLSFPGGVAHWQGAAADLHSRGILPNDQGAAQIPSVRNHS